MARATKAVVKNSFPAVPVFGSPSAYQSENVQRSALSRKAKEAPEEANDPESKPLPAIHLLLDEKKAPWVEGSARRRTAECRRSLRNMSTPSVATVLLWVTGSGHFLFVTHYIDYCRLALLGTDYWF